MAQVTTLKPLSLPGSVYGSFVGKGATVVLTSIADAILSDSASYNVALSESGRPNLPTDANRYEINDSPELVATITDVDGVATAADIMFMRVKQPNGTITSYALTTNMTSLGDWSAATNTPNLADGTGTKGNYYTVSVAGSVDFGNGSITFTVGDWVFYDGSRWRKADNGEVGSFTNPSTGVYKIAIMIYENGEGIWHYGSFGDGNVSFGSQHKFFVDASEFN